MHSIFVLEIPKIQICPKILQTARKLIMFILKLFSVVCIIQPLWDSDFQRGCIMQTIFSDDCWSK